MKCTGAECHGKAGKIPASGDSSFKSWATLAILTRVCGLPWSLWANAKVAH